MIFVNPEAFVNRNIPNLNVAYAATFFNVPVIDLNTEPKPKKRYLDKETDVLGISIQTRTYQEALKIKKNYLKKYPRSSVKSISGPLDIQCCYQFLNFEENINPQLKFSDDLPFPNYELFDSFKTFKTNWQNGHWLYAIMTSLGCPFSCTYCSARDRKWLPRSPKNCFEELRQAKEKWQIKSFKILDDCFNISEQRVIEFCQLIKKLNLTWTCANGIRADLFTENMAKAMSDAGCQHVGFGIESSDPEILIEIKKGETIEQIEKAVKTAKKYFPKVSGFLIIGLPGSSFDKDLKSLQWAQNLGIEYHFSYFIPFQSQKEKGAIFWGEKAKPVTNAYPKRLQKKIYRLAQKQRGIETNLLAKVKKRVGKIFKSVE